MIDLERVQRALEMAGCDEVTAAVWAFGSEVSGRKRSDSDVDLAVLFTSPVPPSTMLDLRAELENQLENEVDLIDLFHCSPILATQVIRTGKLLIDRVPFVRANFVASLPSRHYDLLRVRRAAEERMMERVRNG